MSPYWVPRAIVTEEAGGMTSHAAIVSRELGIPCIVGVKEGTRRLKDGMVVTVNAREGTVIEGVVGTPAKPDAAPGRPALEAPVDYPLLIRPAAEAVARGKFDRGIVLGGSGNGEAMVANRVRGVRCSLCWNVESARLALLDR